MDDAFDMTFAPGDWVHMAGLGTGVVLEARGRHRYAIDIKGRIVIASASDLQPADPAAPRHRRTTAPLRAPNGDSSPAASARTHDTGRDVVLDLHGQTVADAIASVEAFINEALIANRSEVRIVHGRGSGRVKAAVHQYLARLSSVASFRVDPRNPGVTIVSFA